jgi:hypothetical protein
LNEIREIIEEQITNAEPTPDEEKLPESNNTMESNIELGRKSHRRIHVAWTRLIQILLPHTRQLAPTQTQAIALTWLTEFIILAQQDVIHFVVILTITLLLMNQWLI